MPNQNDVMLQLINDRLRAEKKGVYYEVLHYIEKLSGSEQIQLQDLFERLEEWLEERAKA
ncbi:MAG: hypothetical protein UHM85_06040 [Acutalibacteraceae bacterium]|nr:hypothetical protein [Acutalibacteraceae bacterium]